MCEEIRGYKTATIADRYGKQRSKVGHGYPINISFCPDCYGWAYYTPGDRGYIVPTGHIVTNSVVAWVEKGR